MVGDDIEEGVEHTGCLGGCGDSVVGDRCGGVRLCFLVEIL